MTKVVDRTTALRATLVRGLHTRIVHVDEALLFAAPSDDQAVEELRAQACDLSAELLATLAQLERQLRGTPAEQREAIATWMASQAAGSGLVHAPKPNARRTDGVKWPARQAELQRVRAARTA